MTSLYDPFPFGLERSRAVWDRLIRRYGDLAILRQSGQPDLWVSYMLKRDTPLERLGNPSNPVDHDVLLSTLRPEDGTPLPREPSEKDTLITLKLGEDGTPLFDNNGNGIEDERMKLFTPPEHVGPSRRQLYWKLRVRA